MNGWCAGRPAFGLASWAMVAAVAACGSGSTAAVTPPSPPPPVAPAPPPAPVPRAVSIDVPPGQILFVPLSSIGLAQGAEVTGTVPDDIAARIIGQDLRLILLRDSGGPSSRVLTIRETGGPGVQLTVRSDTPLNPVLAPPFRDAPDPEGTAEPAPPEITVTGIDAANRTVAGALTLQIAGQPRLDTATSRLRLIDEAGAVTRLPLSPDMVSATGLVTVSASQMAALLDPLAAGSISAVLEARDPPSGLFTDYEFAFYKATAVLRGSVVNGQGVTLAGYRDRTVVVRSADGLLTRSARIDSSGAFEVAGLVPGTYNVSLVDLEWPNLIQGTVFIGLGTGATTVSLLEVLVPAGPAAAAGSAGGPDGVPEGGPEGGVRQVTSSWSSWSSSVGPSQPAASATGSGAASPLTGAGRPDLLARPSAASQPAAQVAASCITGPDTQRTFRAIATLQSQTQLCSGPVTIPRGTQRVGVVTTVNSEEYPTFTTAQSIYNDTWAANVSFPGGTVSPVDRSGSVNETHLTSSQRRFTDCIDVAQFAATANRTAFVRAAATNVSDGVLPTEVIITVSLSCEDEIAVTEARFSRLNERDYWVVQGPPEASNRLGSSTTLSISLPDSGSAGEAAAWGIPLRIRYTPEAAELTGLRFGFVRNSGQVQLIDQNLLDQAERTAPGVLTVPSFRPPAFASYPWSDRTVGLMVVLDARVGDRTIRSASTQPNIALNGNFRFRPLLSRTVLSNRRYGARDPGGDAWSAAAMTSWLNGRPRLVFDDISGLHVAQFSRTATCGGTTRRAGAAVLCHAGHTNGHQVDLRYADGAGGFAPPLNGERSGAAILTLIANARADVLAGRTGTDSLTRLVAWIGENRTVIGQAASDTAVKEIYVADKQMGAALIQGTFLTGPAIPGVTPWPNVSPKIRAIAGHQHHWHVSLVPQ